MTKEEIIEIITTRTKDIFEIHISSGTIFVDDDISVSDAGVHIMNKRRGNLYRIHSIPFEQIIDITTIKYPKAYIVVSKTNEIITINGVFLDIRKAEVIMNRLAKKDKTSNYWITEQDETGDMRKVLKYAYDWNSVDSCNNDIDG